MVTTFETFDFDRYQRAPRLTFEGALALGAALLERRPAKAPAHVIRTAERLASAVAEGREALTVRLRETGTPYTPDEMSLDMAADALWSTLRSRLEGWLVFEHPGFVPVVETTGRRSRTASSLALAQRNAARARTLLDRIFGPRGLTFAQASYPEQAEAMAALLRMIDEDELKDDLDELVGAPWLATLILVQERYEAMVHARLGRTPRLSGDLAQLRARLQRMMTRYNAAVLTMLDEEEPESLAVVTEALRPFETVRASIRRRGSSGERGEEAGDEDETSTSELDEDEGDMSIIAQDPEPLA